MSEMSDEKYKCELCNKVFKQKIDYTRHTNGKKSCIPNDKIKEKINVSIETSKKTNILKSIFDNCLDILRDNESLTGEKALRTLSRLIILRLLESKFGSEIDIDNYEYDFSHYDGGIERQEREKEKLLKYVRFSNLATVEENEIMIIIKDLWEDILSVHPTTKIIFQKDKSFDIQRQTTFKKIIKKLNETKFEEYDLDILGDSYENVVKDIMTGKFLGQFFTQPIIKSFMIDLVNPQIDEKGQCETVYDLALGVAGFLISTIKHLKDQSKTKNIPLDWKFMTEKGLGGRETEFDTHQLAISNMLIYSGHIFSKTLEKGDSIRDTITNKYDIVLANPPFGIKGLTYKDIHNSLRDEYLPIETNNAVSLFIQAIIYILKINGRCAVVLPDGQDLFGKSEYMVLVREYLLKTCDLKEVIYMPSGVFTNTSIKTCVFYFFKKVEGVDVLKIDDSKKKRQYKFLTKTHQTKEVKFYDYNPYEKVKNLLAEVSINDIANNSYSLNYAEYIKEEIKDDYDESIEIKTLGEVCKFLPKSKRNAKYGNKDGLYPFFKSSIKVDTYVDEPDYEEESLIIGDGGEPNINYGIKFSTSDHCYILQNKNKSLLNIKYAYYYLYHNLDIMKQLYTGVAIKNISKTNIEGIKIPFPSLERQQEIVEYLDFIYEKTNKTSQEKIEELKKLNMYILKNQKLYGLNDHKKLKEVCYINPENIKSNTYQEINYIDISSVKNGKILEIKNIKDDFPSRAKRLINKEDILYSSVRPNLKGYVYIENYIKNGVASTGFVQLRKKSQNIYSKYLYYFITSDDINEDLVKKAKGAQYPSVTFEDFESIEIPIPSLERQKEIVEYCEKNDALISSLEREIEINKELVSKFLKDILKCNDKSDIPENYDLSEASENSNHEVLDEKNEKEESKSNSSSPKKIICDSYDSYDSHPSQQSSQSNSPRASVASVASSTIEDRRQLLLKTVPELKEEIKRLGIKKPLSKLKKEELIDTIINKK
jgi:type I restriction-modification system DNA methylase subunit/restriction endonuclease S subunit